MLCVLAFPAGGWQNYCCLLRCINLFLEGAEINLCARTGNGFPRVATRPLVSKPVRVIFYTLRCLRLVNKYTLSITCTPLSCVCGCGGGQSEVLRKHAQPPPMWSS
jgi:hypothetical protein